MNYVISVEIECPVEDVTALLMNHENLKHWQKGLVSTSLLEGTPGKQGCKSKLKYKIGKQKLTLTETLSKVALPSELHIEYQTNGVCNLQKNYFTPTDKGTQWRAESEFTFTSIYMRIMGFVMPGAFKKQSREYMLDFKKFAEQEISVSHETN